MKATPITVKQYLRDQLSKDNKTHTEEEILRHFEQQPWQDENCACVETNLHRQKYTV